MIRRGVAVCDWLSAHRVSVGLGLILSVAAGLRLISFIGYGYQGDDAVYADLAYRILTGGFLRVHDEPGLIYPVRLGILVPAAVSFKLFGVSEQALGVYPLFVSLLGILVAFLAGKTFFGERVGVFAALLHALLPVDVRYGTLLYPDPSAALWLNVAVLLLYVGSREPLAKTKAVHGALAGLCLGLSWLCKEAVLFSLPFIAGYVLWCLYREKANSVLAASLSVGFGAVLGIEAAAYSWYLADPLYHLHAIERHSRHPSATPWFWSPEASWSQLAARLFRDGPQAILLSTRFGLVTVVATLAVCYALFKGWKSFAFVSAWFMYHALVFNFGSHSLRNYMPLPTYDRYLWPLFLPSLLLTAAFVDAVFRDGKRVVRWREADNVFWAGMLAAVLALGFVHGIYRNFKEESVFMVEKTLSKMVSPDMVVYSDGITLLGLRFFWAYPERTRLIEFGGMRSADISGTAYVLVNPKRAEILVQQGWKPPDFFYREVPNAWVQRWESSPARLYWVPQ